MQHFEGKGLIAALNSVSRMCHVLLTARDEPENKFVRFAV
jgi:hypothetical protein